LRAYVATHNRGSMRVLEKCGFRQAGEAPDGIGEVLFQLGA
jgi:RimJ/RimL family protein N-acetyltransferase